MASAKAAAPAMDAATEKTFEIEKKCWELYFKETTVETAVEPPRLGVRPTVDTVVDTKDHPFITDPMLAMVRLLRVLCFLVPHCPRPCSTIAWRRRPGRARCCSS